jgi:hypothetical protein
MAWLRRAYVQIERKSGLLGHNAAKHFADAGVSTDAGGLATACGEGMLVVVVERVMQRERLMGGDAAPLIPEVP